MIWIILVNFRFSAILPIIFQIGMRISLRLGEILVRQGKIGEEDLAHALQVQKEKGGKLGEILVRLGMLSEEDIYGSLSSQFGIPYVEIKEEEIDEEVLGLLPSSLLRKHRVIPVRKRGGVLTLALSDPAKLVDLKELKLVCGCEIEPVLVKESTLERLLAFFEKGAQWKFVLGDVLKDLQEKIEPQVEVVEEREEEDVERMVEDAGRAPVVRIVNALFYEALRRNASDIHIEPYEHSLRVRLRVDGVLQEVLNLRKEMKDAIQSRIKVLSRMDIAERRLPQDGRIKMRMTVEGRARDVDIRVSATPTIYGEKIVMRILDKEGLMLDLGRLGFEAESLRRFEEALSRPWGMILVTGPTGSGKTNTLYSAISKLNTPQVNIMTVEDPVEYSLQGINQVQVNEAIGLTFSSVLRSFLRQDPDIILVGEIRDNETAEIAVKASLTGHLVLSTLHTNDAPQAITRLVEMGIDPYLVATSLILVCAQRLVRRICGECKEQIEVNPKLLRSLGFKDEELEGLRVFRGRGCRACGNTGYKGRVGLFEVMPLTDPLRDLVFSGSGAKAIREKALEEGMVTLRRSGLEKIKQGITTIEEVLRETF